jgi:hypothetical protein
MRIIRAAMPKKWVRSSLPKAQKRGDLQRMLHSENSEDYVTWNAFQLLGRTDSSKWWPKLLTLAGRCSLSPDEHPTVHLWQTVDAPRAYEALSRERMRRTPNEAWRARSYSSAPVEGPSEIDIVFEGQSYLVFVEAKLGSDVSLSTTYDPERNQIVRNIDCLLEVCGRRTPVFWMLVRDKDQSRAYMQLMRTYRDPAALRRGLPHRNIQQLTDIAENSAVVRWRDFIAMIPAIPEDRECAFVRLELDRRTEFEE